MLTWLRASPVAFFGIVLFGVIDVMKRKSLTVAGIALLKTLYTVKEENVIASGFRLFKQFVNFRFSNLVFCHLLMNFVLIYFLLFGFCF